MKAAVFFPGIGYHCDKPLLYYSRKLAQECGYEETIALSYTYDGGNIRGNEEKMQQAFESLYEQAEKSLSAIDFDKYDEILFVAKSVGTIIASAYAEKHSIRCRQILYCPVIEPSLDNSNLNFNIFLFPNISEVFLHCSLYPLLLLISFTGSICLYFKNH